MSRTFAQRESGEDPNEKRTRTRRRTAAKRSRKRRSSRKRERKVFGVLRLGKTEEEQPEAVNLNELWDTAQQLLRLASLQMKSQSELQAKLLGPKATATSTTP